MPHPQSDFLIRLPFVRTRVGLSRSTIYRLLKDGAFPAPVRIGSRSVAWKSSEIDEWVNSRPVLGDD
jgi:prophage regulatory protein